ncbi:MAG: SpoVR family protein [Candidatus Obscuribacterales bacterium]|nr:SpoVR family protein [Candidatus Obscuribacterales bacterium]
MHSEILTSDPLQAQRVRNLQVLLPRIKAIGDRYGCAPCRAIFRKKSDIQLMDDLIYPLGIPVSRKAWWYGKAAYQQRRGGQTGHVFEFATISNPAEVVLGDTNDLMMDILVIIHAWMGHVHLFHNNLWHAETQAESCLQKFAQDEAFVDGLLADHRNWGADRYEYYADAAHALEHHSGELPTPKDAVPEDELRAQLIQTLDELRDKFILANTLQDKEQFAEEIRDTARLLSCHPILPTSDILGFLMNPDNTKHLPDEARRIIEMTRFENRYSTQVVGRTKIMHEGFSHWVDAKMPHEPELDLLNIGFDHMIDAARYDTMHDAWPIYWFSDPYSLGQEIWNYIDEKYSKEIGTEVVRFRRLKVLTQADVDSGKYPVETITLPADSNGGFPEATVVTWTPRAGDIVETDEWVEETVKKYDRSFLFEVARTYDDTRFFHTFLTEEFFQRLHKKALDWVNKMFMLINGTLKNHRWDPSLVFEDDRMPISLEEMYQVVSIWQNQIKLREFIGMLGYGGPGLPVSQTSLWQMLQIIQTVASYDYFKDQFKRQMILRTGLQVLPNIKLVDTGRYNNAGVTTIRHEYDPNFGPLKEGYARQTLRYLWRFTGPVRLLTMEILTDSYGRPWGPPRPYQYYTENGKTVKERWL